MTWALDLARILQADDNSPPLFGVILYTNSHPNIKKVLRDDDYWTALDELSGTKWAVFAVRTRLGNSRQPPTSPEYLESMVAVGMKKLLENAELLSVFKIEDTENLPALVIFIVDGDDVQRTVVRLDDSSLTKAYSSLKAAFKSVSDALIGLDEQDRQNPSVVFEAVKNNLRVDQVWKIIKGGYKVIKGFLGLG